MFLFIKTSSLGDIIQSFPALSLLRQKFPQAVIDWVVEKPHASLLKCHPAINSVITMDSKAWRKGKNIKDFFIFKKKLQASKYDAVFDLQGNIKSGLILSLTRTKEKVGFGWKTAHEWPNAFFSNKKFDPPLNQNIRKDYLYLIQSYVGDFTTFISDEIDLLTTSEEQKKVDDFLTSLPQTKKILIAPKTAWPNKELGEEQLISFLQKMEGYFLFSWGKKEEEIVAQRLTKHFPSNSSVLPYLSIPLLQYCMRKMDLVVAMDSLPLHLAGTTRTETWSFFGPTKGEKFKPMGERHKFTQGTCPYGVTFKKTCPKLRSCKTGDCLKQLCKRH